MFMYLLILLESAWITTIIRVFECCAVTGFGFECCTATEFLTVLLEFLMAWLESVSSDLANARCADGLASSLSNLI